MGIARIRTLTDLSRVDAHLAVRCPACGREVIFQRQGIVSWFQHKGWNTALEVAGQRFRCTGCDHRGAVLGIAPRTALAAPDRPRGVVRRGA